MESLSDLLKATWKPVFDPDFMAPDQMPSHSACLHKEALKEGGRGKNELLCAGSLVPRGFQASFSLGSRNSQWVWLPLDICPHSWVLTILTSRALILNFQKSWVLLGKGTTQPKCKYQIKTEALCMRSQLSFLLLWAIPIKRLRHTALHACSQLGHNLCVVALAVEMTILSLSICESH